MIIYGASFGYTFQYGNISILSILILPDIEYPELALVVVPSFAYKNLTFNNLLLESVG